ncbi:MAG: hypothetical protein HRT35_31515, partial [Algicola sp.]|nr:hypothetical protein [Algicola sp.]
MAYNNYFGTASVAYVFSTPTKQCNGLPCGLAQSDPNSADAVSALNAVRHEVAGFFRQNPVMTLATDALAAVPDPSLRACISAEIAASTNLKYAGLLDSVTCRYAGINSIA